VSEIRSFFALQRKKEKNKPLEIFFTATSLSGTSPSLPSLPHLKKEKREGVGQVLVAFIRGGKGARYLPAICSYGLAFVGACCLRKAGKRRERL